MPIRDNFYNSSLTDNTLPPHQRRNRKNNNGSSINIEDSANIYIKLTSGEAIDIGKPIAVYTDGKGYIASNIASDKKSVVGISIDKVTVNVAFRIKVLLKTLIPEASFIIGQNVFLGDSGQITSIVPLFESGKIFQKIGKAVSENEIIIDIGTPYTIE